MTPIRTGAQIYLEEYKTYHIGDLYQIGGVYICKCNPRDSFEPIRADLHLRAHKIEDLWLENHHIIICLQHNAQYLGYDGTPLKELQNDGR